MEAKWDSYMLAAAAQQPSDGSMEASAALMEMANGMQAAGVPRRAALSLQSVASNASASVGAWRPSLAAALEAGGHSDRAFPGSGGHEAEGRSFGPPPAAAPTVVATTATSQPDSAFGHRPVVRVPAFAMASRSAVFPPERAGATAVPGVAAAIAPARSAQVSNASAASGFSLGSMKSIQSNVSQASRASHEAARKRDREDEADGREDLGAALASSRSADRRSSAGASDASEGASGPPAAKRLPGSPGAMASAAGGLDGSESGATARTAALERLLRDQEHQEREAARELERREWSKAKGAEPLPLGLRRAAPRRWTAEEDEALKSAVLQLGARQWRRVAAMVPGRSHVQCLQRWKKVLCPGLRKGQWTDEEDCVLRNAVAEGHSNWGAVARRVPGRTAKQCRERWSNYLAPSVVQGGWSTEEDLVLLGMHRDSGRKWAAIARAIEGRSENAVKLRFKSLERHGVVRAFGSGEPVPASMLGDAVSGGGGGGPGRPRQTLNPPPRRRQLAAKTGADSSTDSETPLSSPVSASSAPMAAAAAGPQAGGADRKDPAWGAAASRAPRPGQPAAPHAPGRAAERAVVQPPSLDPAFRPGPARPSFPSASSTASGAPHPMDGFPWPSPYGIPPYGHPMHAPHGHGQYPGMPPHPPPHHFHAFARSYGGDPMAPARGAIPSVSSTGSSGLPRPDGLQYSPPPHPGQFYQAYPYMHQPGPHHGYMQQHPGGVPPARMGVLSMPQGFQLPPPFGDALSARPGGSGPEES